MPQPDPFAAFPLSHVDRIEIAAQDLLLDDTQISTWCAGRVYRLPDPTMVPLTDLPALFVVAARTQQQPDLQSEDDVFVELKLVGFYEEGRDRVEPTERTVSGLVEELLRIIAGTGDSTLLIVPRYSSQPLVDRLDQIFDTDYQVVEQQQPNLEEGEASPTIIRAVEQRLLYSYLVDRDTREKVGFTP
jgi:hypothetical protein